MKRILSILLLILALNLSSFNQVHAITKNEIKDNLKTFFETDEARIKREKEEKSKQLYEKYFFEIDDKFKKVEERIDAAAKSGDSDESRLKKEYDKYLNNKNNMEHNRYLCDMLDTWEKQYKEIIARINDEYKQAYEKMRGTTTSREEFESFKKINPDMEGFRFSETVKTKLKTIEKINEEVSNYSYAYEQKKVANFMAMHKRKKLCGQIANFVYMPVAGNPQIGCLYSYNLRASFPLTVIQSTPNGILVTGDYSIGYASTMRNAFIQTNKKFVDNQILRDYGMYEYLGIMNYRSVLGVQNTVWKFRQLSMDEIRKNFDIGNKLYFYQQY